MALSWICIIALGALMGLVGQGVRVVVGLKKSGDDAAATGRKFTDTIDSKRLLISLLIGAVAGVLAAVATLTPDTPVAREALLGLAAAGYSGADFVEGFIARYLPGRGQRPPSPALEAIAPVPSPAEARPHTSATNAGLPPPANKA